MAKFFKRGSAKKTGKSEEMSFLDHLEDLRVTIIKCVAVLFFCGIFTCVFAFKINEILMWPFDVAVADLGRAVERPRVSSPFAPFVVYFQIIIFGALFLALPFILYFIAQFILPALTKRERGVLLPGLSVATGLFVAGACMAYFVLLPIMLGVSFRLTDALSMSELYDAGRYYSTITLVILGVGISFELPLLVAILIYVGILDPVFLRKYRRHIFVLIVIFSAVVTPPDPVTLILMSGPLYLLYELAVIVGERLLKRKLASQKAEEEAEEQSENKEYNPYEDSRYLENASDEDEDDIEKEYYQNYEEDRQYYPDDVYDEENNSTLADAAENEAGDEEAILSGDEAADSGSENPENSTDESSEDGETKDENK